MTLLLDAAATEPATAGSARPVDVDRCTQTIDSYDRSAAVYAERLSQANLEPYLTRFRDRLRSNATVLDGGCGAGRDVKWLIENGLTAIGLDLSAGMLAEARLAAPTATFIHADLRDIPMADDTVDGVWLCASMLHLAPADALAALREVHRVLVPGGSVFVSTAAGRGSEWRATKLGRRWFQLYDQSELTDLMSAAGLLVVESITEAGVVQGRWVDVTAEKIS